jgi:hypothetical protein
MEQKEKDKGTTIVTDAVPDSELHPENFDAEFDKLMGLGTSEAPGVTQLTQEQIEEKEKKDAETKAAGKPDETEEKLLDSIVAGTVEEGVLAEEEKAAKAAAEAASKVTSDDFKKLSDEKKVEFLQKQIDSTKIDYEKTVTELKTKVTEQEAKLTTLANVQAAFEQVQKEPHVFIRKYFPQLAEKLDPQKAIIAKLREEFGQDFIYDHNESFTEGTTSYKIRLREAELRDNFQREQAKADAELLEGKRQHEARFLEGKKKVMQQYKLTEAGFLELQEWAVKKVITPVEWAMLKYYDDNMKKVARKAIEVAKKLKASVDHPGIGAAEIAATTDDEASSQAYKEHQSVFGDV